MTNQASGDELEAKLNTIIFARFYDIPDKQRSTVVKNLQALIRTEKLKLLAEVRERVVGKDEPGITNIMIAAEHVRQNKALTKLEAEL
jgi:hypothetical protein